MAVIKLGNLWNKRQKNRKYSKWRIRNGKYTKCRIKKWKIYKMEVKEMQNILNSG